VTSLCVVVLSDSADISAPKQILSSHFCVLIIGVMISNGNLLCGMSGQCERVVQLG